MLVISRKASQRILIGEEIWITVVRCSPQHVRIGIDAPPDIPISRAELLTTDLVPVAESSVMEGSPVLEVEGAER